MQHRFTAALVVAVLLLPLSAAARVGPEGPFALRQDQPVEAVAVTRPAVELQRPRRALADPDADGRVTSAEAMEFFRRHFEALDRNRDDQLQERELLRIAVTRAPDADRRRATDSLLSFKKLDRDGDGRLSPAEFRRGKATPARPWTRARLARLFAGLDDDRDGVVGRERFMTSARGYHSRCARPDGVAPLGRFLAGMPF